MSLMNQIEGSEQGEDEHGGTVRIGKHVSAPFPCSVLGWQKSSG